MSSNLTKGDRFDVNKHSPLSDFSNDEGITRKKPKHEPLERNDYPCIYPDKSMEKQDEEIQSHDHSYIVDECNNYWKKEDQKEPFITTLPSPIKEAEDSPDEDSEKMSQNSVSKMVGDHSIYIDECNNYWKKEDQKEPLFTNLPSPIKEADPRHEDFENINRNPFSETVRMT